ncbi:MAG: transposase [Sedimentisphaerales bacterium]|nr:transposase [Sedimentisphaerales bacterium]
MPNYIRAKFEGGYYFFTVVTYDRVKLFNSEIARKCLKKAIQETRSKRPYDTVAFCLLPEHLHCVWKMPENDSDFSTRWSSIKGLFSIEYLRLVGRQEEISESRKRKGEVCLWQRQFWEHQIRNENDLQRHIDYIHYNPVKHELVSKVEDWKWSTYHRYVREGFYGKNNDFEDIVKIEIENFGE